MFHLNELGNVLFTAQEAQIGQTWRNNLTISFFGQINIQTSQIIIIKR